MRRGVRRKLDGTPACSGSLQSCTECQDLSCTHPTSLPLGTQQSWTAALFCFVCHGRGIVDVVVTLLCSALCFLLSELSGWFCPKTDCGHLNGGLSSCLHESEEAGGGLYEELIGKGRETSPDPSKQMTPGTRAPAVSKTLVPTEPGLHLRGARAPGVP